MKVRHKAALLTASGFLLKSACVVVQLAKASAIVTAKIRRAVVIIFISNPSFPGDNRRNGLYVKLQAKISLTHVRRASSLARMPIRQTNSQGLSSQEHV